MNELPILAVLAAGILIGMAVCAAVFERRLAAVLEVVSRDSDVAHAALRLSAEAASAQLRSLAQLEMEDASPQRPLELAQGARETRVPPDLAAANDALGAASDASTWPKTPLFGTGSALAALRAPKRPCDFCRRVRAFFSREASSVPQDGS